jgi:hypothetical protein
MVLTVSFVLSPVTGLSCHRHRRSCLHRLDTSVGASGPHDFAVRFSAIRQERIRVHRIPPRVRDDREPPLCGTGRGELVEMICPTGKAEYFCKGGWTDPSPDSPSGKSVDLCAVARSANAEGVTRLIAARIVLLLLRIRSRRQGSRRAIAAAITIDPIASSRLACERLYVGPGLWSRIVIVLRHKV